MVDTGLNLKEKSVWILTHEWRRGFYLNPISLVLEFGIPYFV